MTISKIFSRLTTRIVRLNPGNYATKYHSPVMACSKKRGISWLEKVALDVNLISVIAS